MKQNGIKMIKWRNLRTSGKTVNMIIFILELNVQNFHGEELLLCVRRMGEGSAGAWPDRTGSGTRSATGQRMGPGRPARSTAWVAE
jgi:hypothetical protein